MLGILINMPMTILILSPNESRVMREVSFLISKNTNVILINHPRAKECWNFQNFGENSEKFASENIS